MRVLAFCDYFHPHSPGGAERVAAEVYRRVADDEVEVLVLGAIPRQFGPSDASECANTHLRIESFRGFDLTGLTGAQLMVAPGHARRARAAIDAFRPDVIHVNGLHFHSSITGVRAARRAGLPAVTTAHLGDVSTMPGRFAAASVAFDRHVGGWVARSSDHVLAVSESVRAHMVELGVPAERVSVATNGVDHTRFHPRGRGPRTSALRVALVGRLVANKGVVDALGAVGEARRQGHDIQLEVLGDGPLMDDVRRRAEAEDLRGAVRFHGFVDDVATWLRRVDVLLRPSLTEGLPLGVLEAMACGVAVVCSDVPGNVEAVGEHESAGLVVDKGDVVGLAAALGRLDTDRDELDRLADRGVQRAAAFTWERSATHHLEAWQDAAMHTRRSPQEAQ